MKQQKSHKTKASRKPQTRPSQGRDLNKGREERPDQLGKGKRSAFPNDPNWYYGDPVIADEISRFSFNQFAGITDPLLRYDINLGLPTICVMAMNPCPGVTPQSISAGDPKARGMNQALQQWWSVLTSRSGRGATYSKADVGMLLLAIGEIISTIEHLRRFIGVAFTYNLRNRMIPTGLIDAMGVDSDDLLANLADYRLRLNSLILRLNKIPIPGNIDYFTKCQNMYQRVYVDSVSPMSQIYVHVPASTWTINESLSSTGTVLETTGLYLEYLTGSTNEYRSTVRRRTFGDYLSILDGMISALINSSTFSNIYSDLLNAASMGNINLWSFDLVPENYIVAPEYNEMALLMIHNTQFMGRQYVANRSAWISHIEGSGTPQWDWGTPLNDVFADPIDDIVRYNPNFLGNTINNRGSKTGYHCPMLVDVLNPSPDVNTRIEATVYATGVATPGMSLAPGLIPYTESGAPSVSANQAQLFNMILPDHYAVCAVITSDESDADQTEIYGPGLSKIDSYGGGTINSLVLSGAADRASYILSKFQWAPIVWVAATDTDWGFKPTRPIGELNYYTILNNEWIENVTDAKYFGLFDIN